MLGDVIKRDTLAGSKVQGTALHPCTPAWVTSLQQFPLPLSMQLLPTSPHPALPLPLEINLPLAPPLASEGASRKLNFCLKLEPGKYRTNFTRAPHRCCSNCRNCSKQCRRRAPATLLLQFLSFLPGGIRFAFSSNPVRLPGPSPEGLDSGFLCLGERLV